MERAQSGPRFFFRHSMNHDLEELTAEVRRRVDELGFEVVDVRRRGSKTRPILEIRIDHPGSTPGCGVTSQDCAVVSRGLERWLDETQLLGLNYTLEVSSPGIERPIRWPEHWRRFRGQDVHVKTHHRRMRATIVDVTEDDAKVVLNVKGQAAPVVVALDDIKDATLVVDWD